MGYEGLGDVQGNNGGTVSFVQVHGDTPGLERREKKQGVAKETYQGS